MGVVIYLFAAFGGFLKEIAPPDDANPKFAVGLASFCVLIIVLGVAAVGQRQNAAHHRKLWIRAALVCFMIAVIAAPAYYWSITRLTYRYPPHSPIQVRKVKGLRFTEAILNDFSKNAAHARYRDDPATLESKYEGDIWTPESITTAKLLLLFNYTVLVLSISTSIFCLLEARLAASNS